jgi:Domain of unknown function (DUF4276)
MRLLNHVEGITEETFTKEILAPHLLGAGYDSVGARLVGNARLRSRRGGTRAWSDVKRDIVRHLRSDEDAVATTMVDYYGMPATGPKAWPGRAGANDLEFARKAETVQAALLNDVVADMGGNFDPQRFVPFVVMHEFEGLLFSDCDGFARAIGQERLASQFHKIRDEFETPEEINDSPHTAPSKRIELLLPHYDKSFFGNVAALEIGLEKIRRQCPHFEKWLTTLEGIPSSEHVR